MYLIFGPRLGAGNYVYNYVADNVANMLTMLDVGMDGDVDGDSMVGNKNVDREDGRL